MTRYFIPKMIFRASCVNLTALKQVLWCEIISNEKKRHKIVSLKDINIHIFQPFPLELPMTFITGFSGCRDLPIRFIEEVSERVEVAKNYRAIPVVPTVLQDEKFIDMPKD